RRCRIVWWVWVRGAGLRRRVARRPYPVRMSAVALVLVLLMVVFAISGYRQGFVIGVLSFFGFFGGALIGLQVGPLLAEQFSDNSVRGVVALVSLFGLAV